MGTQVQGIRKNIRSVQTVKKADGALMYILNAQGYDIANEKQMSQYQSNGNISTYSSREFEKYKEKLMRF